MASVLDKLVTILSFQADLSQLRRFDSAIANTRKRLNNISSGAFNVGRQLTIAGGIATGVFGLAAKAAIDWESDFTGVRKTVTATEEEFAALEKTLRTMAKSDVPVPVGELAALAESAGQLGIQTANIEDFVKVMAQLGTTTNIDAEEGAKQLARFANITGMSQGDFDNLGATIVDLGNNFATTEAEIVTMALRLAGAGNIIGLTEAQIVSTATALSSMGVRAESGGTAFSRVFVEMQKAVQTGSAELDTFGSIIGKTGGEFAGIFTQQGADVALVEFINGLQDIISSGGNVHAVLEELGFDNVRIRDALLRSAGAGDLLENALSRGTEAWDENIALTREAELRYNTTAAKLQRAKNQLNDLAITAGNVLVPTLTSLLEAMEPLIAKTTEFAEKHPTLIKYLALASIVLLALGVGFLAVGVLFKAASFALAGFSAAIKTTIFLTNLLAGKYLVLMRAQLIAMAVAAKVSAAATWLWNTAMTVGRAISAASVITFVAMAVAAGAAAVATGAMTVAQWLLNAAMYANPVVLIVLAIVALIAALVAAGYFIYKFRDQILGAFKKAWSWIKRNWPLLLAILTGPIGLAVYAILRYKDQIIGAFKAVWDWVRTIWSTIQDRITSPFKAAWNFIRGINLFEAGKAFLQSFLDGILSIKDKVVDGVKGVMSKARDFLPFSDAKVGPLSQLTESGRSLIETFQSGIQQAGNIDLASALLPVGPVPPVAAAAGGGAPIELTITIERIEINAAGGDSAEIAAGIKDELRQQVRQLVEEVDTLIRA